MKKTFFLAGFLIAFLSLFGTVQVTSVDLSSFPEVNLYVTTDEEHIRYVKDNGDSVDFEFNLIGKSERSLVDIVFVFDTTGSMEEEIDALKEGAIDFANKLTASGLNYRLSLVTFGDEIRELKSFTEKAEIFDEWISQINAKGGDDASEISLDALINSLSLNFRDEAQKLLILVSDATYHFKGDGSGFSKISLDEVIEKLRNNGVTLFAVAPSEYKSITDELNGFLININEEKSFKKILEEISTKIAKQYIVRYSVNDFSANKLHIVEVRFDSIDIVKYISPNYQEFDWRYWLGRDELGSSYVDVSGEVETLPDDFDETVIKQGAEIALLGEVDLNNTGYELVTWDGKEVRIFDMNLNLLNSFTPAGMYRINLLEDIDGDGEYEIGMGCRETGYIRFYDKSGNIEWEYQEDIGYDGEFDIGKVEGNKVYIMNSAGYSGTYRGISRVDMETSTLDWRFRTGSEVHNISFYNDLIAFGTNTPHNGFSYNGFDDSHLYHMIVDEEGKLVLGKQVDDTHKNGGVKNYFLYDGYLLGLENHSGYYSGNETLHIVDIDGKTILRKEMRYKNDFKAGLYAAYNEDIIVACDGEKLYTFDAKMKAFLFASDLEEDDLRLYALVETSGSYIVLLGDNNDEQIRIIEINKEGTEIIDDKTIDVETGEIRGIIPTVEDNRLVIFVSGLEGMTKLFPVRKRTENLIAYWGMNEGVTSFGTLVDESGNNLDGEVYNKYKIVDGVLGKAIYLYGVGFCSSSGGHVILPYIDFETMDEFTISLWVKEDGLSHYHGEGYIFAGKSRACLTIGHYTGDLRFTVGAGKEERVLSLDFKDEYKSNFVHYCMVYKNGKTKAYVNGNEVGEIINKLEIGKYDNEKKFGLGIHWWDQYGFNEVSTRFIGAIDEVRIYNRALEEDEIKRLFNLNY